MDSTMDSILYDVNLTLFDIRSVTMKKVFF